MPLSKKRQAEWMRKHRANVIPKSDSVIPKLVRRDTGDNLRPLDGIVRPLPNCPDGRYRPETH